MKCAEVQKKLVAFVDGELPADIADRIDAHLQGCADCRAERDAIRNIHAGIAAWPAAGSDFVSSVAAELGLEIKTTTESAVDIGRMTEHLHEEASRRRIVGTEWNPPPPPRPPVAVALGDSGDDDDDGLRAKAEQQLYQARRIAADAEGVVAQPLIDNVNQASTSVEIALNDFDAVVLRRRLDLLNTHLLALSKSFYEARTRIRGWEEPVRVDHRRQDEELDVEILSEETSIARIAHAIVQEAVRRNAGEIHVEPRQNGVRISYRIDGVLQEAMTVPKHIQSQLIARFKILAGLNMAERNAVQKGMILNRIDGTDYDLPVTCSPGDHGEELVMQILEKSDARFDLKEVGLPVDISARPRVSKKPLDHVHLDELLQLVVERNASNLHLAAGIPPIIQGADGLAPTPYESCKPVDIQRMVYAVLTEKQIRTFERTDELLIPYTVEDVARFHVNVFRDNGKIAANARLIPTRIPTLQDLGLPPVVEKLTHTRRGLILVAGLRDAGKTTTSYAMLNHINLNRSERIHTIEDLVSFQMESKMSVVTQQSVGIEIASYEQALNSIRRASPDIVMVGNLPTPAAVAAALRLAEEGHLVIARMPGNSVRNALDILIDRTQMPREIACRALSRVLQAVIAQRLLPRANGRGRIVAAEILIATNDVRESIAAGDTDLCKIIEASANFGTVTMDHSIATAYRRGAITYDTAMAAGVDKSAMMD